MWEGRKEKQLLEHCVLNGYKNSLRTLVSASWNKDGPETVYKPGIYFF